jgi:hypothetical protein
MRSISVPLALVVALAASVAGCGRSGAEPSAPDAGWTTFDDAARGVVVRFPSSWHRAPSRLTPFLAAPRELLALGTFALRPDGRGACAQMPVRALRAAGARDVLLTVLDAGRATSRFPPRRRPFALGAPTRALECVAPDPRRRAYWVPFRDAGRALYALVVVGAKAPGERVRELRRVLDSLRFAPAHRP